MNINQLAISEALTSYLGYGEKIHPTENSDAVYERFASQTPEALLVEIANILKFMDQLKPDWNLHSLETATEWAQSTMRERYPGLTKDALNALGWTFSWWWR